MENNEKRILQLEEALDEALCYLEAIMGSNDYNDSDTIKRILTLLNGEE